MPDENGDVPRIDQNNGADAPAAFTRAEALSKMQRLLADRDSYAPLLIEVALIDKDGKQTLIPTYSFLQSLSIEQVGRGAWTGTLDLFDKGDIMPGQVGTLLETLVVTPGGPNGQTFRFRWNWDNRELPLNDAPTYYGMPTTVEPEFTAEGVALKIDLAARQWGSRALRAFPFKDQRWKDKTASEIFTEIAAQMKWVNPVIEVSKGKLEAVSVPEKQTTFAFIQQTLVGRAVNEDGERFMSFIDKAGVAHFHTRNYGKVQGEDRAPPKDGAVDPALRAERLPQKKIKIVVAAEYMFARGVMGEVISFTPTDFSYFTAFAGGVDAVGESVNSKDGEPVAHKARADEGIDGVAVGVVCDTEKYTPDVRDDTGGAEEMAYLPIGGRDTTESAQRMRAAYDWLRLQKYEAALEVKGTHRVDMLDYINVFYKTGDGEDHYLTGCYQVLKVVHGLGSSGWTTTFNLVRQGLPVKPPESLTQAAATEFSIRDLWTILHDTFEQAWTAFRRLW